jgi:hypothetical protein
MMEKFRSVYATRPMMYSRNRNNLTTAVERVRGSDDLNTRVWWDVADNI